MNQLLVGKLYYLDAKDYLKSIKTVVAATTLALQPIKNLPKLYLFLFLKQHFDNQVDNFCP